MFKKTLTLLTALALFSGALAGCAGDKEGTKPSESGDKQGDKGGEESKYTVKYYVDGSLYNEVKDVAKGSKIQAPEEPVKAEDEDYTYTFDGWYENGATTKWDFATNTVDKNLELYAKFNSEAKSFDLIVWVWGGTTTVYITPEESAALATQMRALPEFTDKTIRWKYVNNLTNPFFNRAVMDAHVSLVISGAKMDNDTIEDEDASIDLDSEGAKVKVGFGWFNSTNRYVGIVNGLSNTEFTLAKVIYDKLQANGPYFFTAAIDNSSILLNQTAQLSAKDAENNPIVEGLTYSIKDEDIASVDENGVVTGLAVGNTVASVHYGFAQRDIDIGVTDKEVNLKVAVWGQNGNSNNYASVEQIEAAENGFIEFAADRDVEVVSRWDRISANTDTYPTLIGDDIMVIISGKNVKTQCGTTTDYVVLNVEFNSTRYMGIKPGFETNPIVLLLAEYLCQDTITVHFADELSVTDQTVTALGGEVVALPPVESSASKIHIGWAVDSEATEALFGTTAELNYNLLKDHAVNKEVTLYPIFSNKEINLKVAVWAQNGSNEYASQDQIDAAEAGFIAYAANLDVEVVSRWDFVSGGTSAYPNNIASDVMVVISGKNVKSQCGTLTDYVVINQEFTSTRYLGIKDGYQTNPIVLLLAKYLCDDVITVKFPAALSAPDQEITILGDEAVDFPEVTGIGDNEELKGWAVAADGEAVFGPTAALKYNELKAHAVAKQVTLYPVIGDKPAVVPDLVVDILLGTASTLNITEDDVALIESTFKAALEAEGLEDKVVEIRADFRGTGASFNTRVNNAGDVDVVIGASNLSSQAGFSGLLEGTVATNITIAISSSSRYAFALAGAATHGHSDLAKLFLSAMAPEA